MNKSELIKAVAKETGNTVVSTRAALECAFDEIKNALASGDNVRLLGFGTFKIREKSERTGRNPQTGENITIPAHKVVAFKPGSELAELVK